MLLLLLEMVHGVMHLMTSQINPTELLLLLSQPQRIPTDGRRCCCRSWKRWFRYCYCWARRQVPRRWRRCYCFWRWWLGYSNIDLWILDYILAEHVKTFLDECHIVRLMHQTLGRYNRYQSQFSHFTRICDQLDLRDDIITTFLTDLAETREGWKLLTSQPWLLFLD